MIANPRAPFNMQSTELTARTVQVNAVPQKRPNLKRSVKLLFPRPVATSGDVDLVLAGATVVDTGAGTITVRTKRILQSRPDLEYGLVRKVTLAVPSGATIRRKSDAGSLTAAGLASATPGIRSSR